MNIPVAKIAAVSAAGTCIIASYCLWQRYILLGNSRFKFRMHRAARALLDTAVLAAASVGTATLAIIQPRLLLTVVSTLLSPAAQYGIRYGPHPRQTLDVHSALAGRTAAAALLHPLPARRGSSPPVSTLRPLVVFVHGGAWAFGESWQYAAACRKAAQLGAVAASVSYRLYPHGNAQDMVDDVILALQHLVLNAAQWGIDTERITLVGHSAGAHLVSMAQMRLAAAAVASNHHHANAPAGVAAAVSNKSGGLQAALPVSVLMAQRILGGLTGAVLKSGVYDIARHYDWEAHRTVGNVAWLSPMDPACGGVEGAHNNSPALLLPSLAPAAAKLLPPQIVYHSPWDETAPFDSAVQLVRALHAAGVQRSWLVTPRHGHFEGHADVMIALMGGNPDAKHSSTYGADLSKAYLQLLAQAIAGERPDGALQELPPYRRIPSEAHLTSMRKQGLQVLDELAKL